MNATSSSNGCASSPRDGGVDGSANTSRGMAWRDVAPPPSSATALEEGRRSNASPNKQDEASNHNSGSASRVLAQVTSAESTALLSRVSDFQDFVTRLPALPQSSASNGSPSGPKKLPPLSSPEDRASGSYTARQPDKSSGSNESAKPSLPPWLGTHAVAPSQPSPSASPSRRVHPNSVSEKSLPFPQKRIPPCGQGESPLPPPCRTDRATAAPSVARDSDEESSSLPPSNSRSRVSSPPSEVNYAAKDMLELVQSGSQRSISDNAHLSAAPIPSLNSTAVSKYQRAPQVSRTNRIRSNYNNNNLSTSATADTAASSRGAESVFQGYLNQTRDRVLDGRTSEVERAALVDGLLTRARELFDTLNGMQAVVRDVTGRRTGTGAGTGDGGSQEALLGGPCMTALQQSSSSSALVTRMDGNSSAITSAGPADDADFVETELLSRGGLNGGRLSFAPSMHVIASMIAPSVQQLADPSASVLATNEFERRRRSSLRSSGSISVACIDVVNNYYVMHLIGVGATARVYLVIDRKTQKSYVMKTVVKRSRKAGNRYFPIRQPTSSLSEWSLEDENAAPAFSERETSQRKHSGGNQSSDSSTDERDDVATTATTVTTANSSPAEEAPLTVDNVDLCSAPESNEMPTNSSPAAAAVVLAAEGGNIAVPQRGLREMDMALLRQSMSHTSGIVIPFVESLFCGDDSLAASAELKTTEAAVQAMLDESGECDCSAANRLAAEKSDASRPNGHVRQLRADEPAAGRMRNPLPTAASDATSAAAPPRRPGADPGSSSGGTAGPAGKAAAPDIPNLAPAEREIRILRRVQHHPHVIRLKEVIDDDEENTVHLVMTYAAHGPLTLVHSYDPIAGIAPCNVLRPFPRCTRLLRQLVDALVYVHRQRIVHNDLKPDNILLTESDGVLLTDFGESVLIPKRPQGQSSRVADSPDTSVMVPHNRWKPSRSSTDSSMALEFSELSASHRTHGGLGMSVYRGMPGGGGCNGASQFMAEVSFRPDSSMFLAADVDVEGRITGDQVIIGTPAFAAPELIESSTCSYHSDTWSFGVVLYAVVFGRLPFAGSSISDTFKQILTSPLTFPLREEVPQNTEMTDATYAQWVSLCSKLLVRDPLQRLSLSAVLSHPLFRVNAPPLLSRGGSAAPPAAANNVHRAQDVGAGDARGPLRPGSSVSPTQAPLSSFGRSLRQSQAVLRMDARRDGANIMSISSTLAQQAAAVHSSGEAASCTPALLPWSNSSSTAPAEADAASVEATDTSSRSASTVIDTASSQALPIRRPPTISFIPVPPSTTADSSRGSYGKSVGTSSEDGTSSASAELVQNSATQPPSLSLPRACSRAPLSFSVNGSASGGEADDENDDLEGHGRATMPTAPPPPPLQRLDVKAMSLPLNHQQLDDTNSSGTRSPVSQSVSFSEHFFSDYRLEHPAEVSTSGVGDMVAAVDRTAASNGNTWGDETAQAAPTTSAQTHTRDLNVSRQSNLSITSLEKTMDRSRNKGQSSDADSVLGTAQLPALTLSASSVPSRDSKVVRTPQERGLRLGSATDHRQNSDSGAMYERHVDGVMEYSGPQTQLGDSAADYYSYWSDGGSGSSGYTEGKREDSRDVQTREEPAVVSKNSEDISHRSCSAKDGPPTAALQRFTSTASTPQPILSNQEEVAGHHLRCKSGVMRTKRRKNWWGRRTSNNGNLQQQPADRSSPQHRQDMTADGAFPMHVVLEPPHEDKREKFPKVPRPPSDSGSSRRESSHEDGSSKSKEKGSLASRPRPRFMRTH